jgi:signal peptidase II
MRKIDWLLVSVPLFLTWGIDRLTKMWAANLTTADFYGPLGFVLHHNHGAMLGLFSTTSPVIRVVSLATGGAFLLFFFVIIQYLLPIKSLVLRSGMSILLGGIIGNVTDRILYGYVIDFIMAKTDQFVSPAFNVADALQWVGYAMIATALIREGEILWPADDSRKTQWTQWINPRFQLRYCFILLFVGLGFAAIAGVYSYTFLRITIIDFAGASPTILNNYLTPFIISFLAVTATFAAILFWVGRILSARIAGPVYAFERFLDDLTAGNPRALKLRTGDEFKNLELLAERISIEMARLKAQTQAQPQTQNLSPVILNDVKNGTDG